MSKRWLTDPISQKKAELRKAIAAVLKTVSNEEIQRQSENVTEKVLSLPDLEISHKISIYVSTDGEVVTDRLISEFLRLGKEVFIPQFIKGDPKMKILKIPSLEEFKNLPKTLWNIRQPAVNSGWQPLQGPLDIVFMPGVAFTKDGGRLGHGMGFYDRWLSKLEENEGKLPLLVGLALREQIVEEVPLATTDVNISTVICSNE